MKILIKKPALLALRLPEKNLAAKILAAKS